MVHHHVMYTVYSLAFLRILHSFSPQSLCKRRSFSCNPPVLTTASVTTGMTYSATASLQWETCSASYVVFISTTLVIATMSMPIPCTMTSVCSQLFINLCRFSSVSYSLVTRSVVRSKSTLIHESSTPPSTSIPIPGLSTSAKPPIDSKAPQTEAQEHRPIFAPKPAPSSATGGVAVKKEGSVKDSFVKEETAGKISTTSGAAAKGAVENVGAGKKKMGSAGGGSLANLWGKAPPKTKTSPSKPAKPIVIAGI